MEQKLKGIVGQYAMITLSCALYAVGFNWCFDPNHLSVGGFTGVAQIINFFIPQAPIGTIIVVLNLPLFILSWKKVGRQWLYATLYATLVSSGMIDLLASATTGGTELAARLLKLKFPGLSIGTLCLSIDAIVVISYAAVFRDLTQALYAMVALFIISKVMDRVVYGGNGAKMAYIISEQYEAITAKLLELDRGVTLLEGRGGFSGSPKNVILCAFSRAQIVSIKSIVKQADPDAFIIVCDAYEILGEGFGVNRPDGL